MNDEEFEQLKKDFLEIESRGYVSIFDVLTINKYNKELEARFLFKLGDRLKDITLSDMFNNEE